MTTAVAGPPRTWGRMTMSETPSPSHAFLRHPNGIRLVLRGHTLGELAGEAGRAIGQWLLAPGHGDVQPGPWIEVAFRGADREAMLTGWLNRLLALASCLQWAPVECRLIEATDSGLRVRLRGVPLAKACPLERASIRANSRLGPDGPDLLADVLLHPQGR